MVLDVQAGPVTAMQQSGEISIIVNDQIKMNNIRIPLSRRACGRRTSKADPMMITFPLTIAGLRSQEQTATVTQHRRGPDGS